jgi:hypothetical protein
MNFTGIDLHTNRFTYCFRTERSRADDPKDRVITTFSFVRLFPDRVKQTIVANTCELKQIPAYMPRLARCNTDRKTPANGAGCSKCKSFPGSRPLVR